MSGDNDSYVLEINTIPGMTDLSDLPAQSKAMGIDYDSLVTVILNSAALPKDGIIGLSSPLSGLTA